MSGRELWLTECPYLDQGLIRPLVRADGRTVLMCDECGAVWLSAQDVEAGRSSQPTATEAGAENGRARWADSADLTSQPWTAVAWRELRPE